MVRIAPLIKYFVNNSIDNVCVVIHLDNSPIIKSGVM